MDSTHLQADRTTEPATVSQVSNDKTRFEGTFGFESAFTGVGPDVNPRQDDSPNRPSVADGSSFQVTPVHGRIGQALETAQGNIELSVSNLLDAGEQRSI